jgi:hypothetical protein
MFSYDLLNNFARLRFPPSSPTKESREARGSRRKAQTKSGNFRYRRIGSDSEVNRLTLFQLKLFSRRLATARIDHNFIGNLLAFWEFPETRTFNRADVNEDIRAAVIWLDEAEALSRVEPFNCTGSHDTSFPIQVALTPAKTLA